MTSNADSTTVNTTRIEITDLTFKRGDQTIINKLSHEFSSGEVTLLTGPSGCGKTTLLRLIAGLEVPDSGKVTASGRLWSNSSQILPPWLRNLDLLFQNDALWPDQTVGDQIAWVRKRRKNGNTNWNIEEITTELGINDLLNRYPAGLSGGEARRCQLARILAGSPSLLLLDEPLSGQDSATAGKTAQLLAKLLASDQVTAIVVSHETAQFADFGWQQLYLPGING